MEHRCRCLGCAPDDFLQSDGRTGPHHFAVRFGDVPLRVFLDGEEVSHRTTETFTGEQGHVVMHALDEQGHFHACRTCDSQEVCQEVRYGFVQVSGELVAGRLASEGG